MSIYQSDDDGGRSAPAPQFHNVEGFDVTSWSPGEEGEEVPCTQVHLIPTIPQLQGWLVMRLKSRAVCDSLIAALIEHRDFVFGAPAADGVEK